MQHWLCSLVLLGVAVTAHAETPPNIILILCDDLRSDVLGCMGDPYAQTPYIDQLAYEGVTFDNAFAVTAICVTSRCNILTGQYASKSGWRHGDFKGDRTLTPEELRQTYLGPLRDADYRLGYAGKWHVGRPPLGYFDDDHAYPGQGNYYEKEITGGAPEHLTSKIAGQVEQMVLKEDDRPFFICVGFKSPHVQDGNKPPFYPYDEELTGNLYNGVEFTPAPLSEPAFFDSLPVFLKRSLNRERWEYRLGTPKLYQESMLGYYRLVAGVDHAVGRIMTALEQIGKKDNTVVIFTSDHGVFLGARGLASKFLPHEPSIRIPMIVRDPRLPGELIGGRRDKLALTIDLAPTILEFAGAPISAEMQGRSLLPMVYGQTPEDWRTDFFYDHYYMPAKIPATEAVRSERWKYIRYVNSDPLYEELYDLIEDPMESINLIGNPDYDFVFKDMEQRWQRLRVEATGVSQ